MGTVESSTASKARKSHQCQWCRAAIEAGEIYMRYRVGQRSTYPVCGDCVESRGFDWMRRKMAARKESECSSK